MKEKKKGLIVESPKLARIMAQALHPLADWDVISDHDLLPPNLGGEMKERGIDIAVIHANKPEDFDPILTILSQGLSVLVITRDSSYGAVESLQPMYDILAKLNVPMLKKPPSVAMLQQKVYELLNPQE